MNQQSGEGVLTSGARSFIAAMRERYACKKFRTDMSLSQHIRDYLMECGRLSPSSFGLEHWQMIGIERPGFVSPWFEACLSQEPVGSASLLAILLVRASQFYHPDSLFIRMRSSRFPGGHAVFKADYGPYYRVLSENRRIMAWARAQSYLAAANMMTGAAFAGVDSCAIEGFSESKILTALRMDPGQWSVGLIVAFGYRDEAPREKIREDFASIVTFFPSETE